MLPDEEDGISESDCTKWARDTNLQTLRRDNLNALKGWVDSHGGVVKRKFLASSLGGMASEDCYKFDDGKYYFPNSCYPDGFFPSVLPVLSTNVQYKEFFGGIPHYPKVLLQMSDGTRLLFDSFRDADLEEDLIHKREKRYEEYKRVAERDGNLSLSLDQLESEIARFESDGLSRSLPYETNLYREFCPIEASLIDEPIEACFSPLQSASTSAIVSSIVPEVKVSDPDPGNGKRG